MHTAQLGNKKVMMMYVVELKEKKSKVKVRESLNDSKHPPQTFVDLKSKLTSFRPPSVLFARLQQQPERKDASFFHQNAGLELDA